MSDHARNQLPLLANAIVMLPVIALAMLGFVGRTELLAILILLGILLAGRLLRQQ